MLLLYLMEYLKIKLDKRHIALNPKLLISTQEQYEYHLQTLLYLKNQLDSGFNPKWFITFHYRHPSEKYQSSKQTSNAYGFRDRYGMTTKKTIWRNIPEYNYYDRRRNNYDNLIEDTSQIKNCILKYLYGIKRLDKEWRYECPNLFFFHEKGKNELQYHTHLLIPEKNLSLNSIEELEDVFNNTIRDKKKCFSRWRRVDVREIDNAYEAVSYVNKETTRKHLSLDYKNSHFIQENKCR